MRRGSVFSSLTSHIQRRVRPWRPCIRWFSLLLEHLELLDDAVEPLQRLVKGHELA
jgi:hypothetical protein